MPRTSFARRDSLKAELASTAILSTSIPVVVMPRGVCDVDFTLPLEEDGFFGLGRVRMS